MKKIILAMLMLFSINISAQESEPRVVLETTQGTIELRLFADVAPLAVENFLTHVKNGYYDGVIFHRIIRDFMIQSGDPTGTGRGGVGHRWASLRAGGERGAGTGLHCNGCCTGQLVSGSAFPRILAAKVWG